MVGEMVGEGQTMNTILATSYDSNYKWGAAWKASLEKHCNIPFEIIDMDETSTKMPNNIIQHGEFLDYLKPGEPDDVIIFSDADCVLQRGFSEKELKWFGELQFGHMAAGFAASSIFSLALEGALGLGRFKNEPGDKFPIIFKDYEKFPTFCTGVVVASRETWQVHRKWFESYWPVVDAIWIHYARIQWLMSYVMGRFLLSRLLPESVTQHGFRQKPMAMSEDDLGNILMDGEKIAIRHAINLIPPKEPAPPKETVRVPIPGSTAPLAWEP